MNKLPHPTNQLIKTGVSSVPCSAKGQYRPIATLFKHKGYMLRQVVREGDVAIYEQRWIRPDGELSENISYEVIRIRRHDGYKLGRNFVKPAEYYPGTREWGTYGFTLTDKERAFEKLRELVEL